MNWIDFEVSCGFGGGEETAQFGPRQETGLSLYQVDTVACVTNKKNGQNLPWMLSVSCLDKLALVIGNNILVFNESCTEHQCSFLAESLVDSVAWSDEGVFLAFTDRCGGLSLAHVGLQKIIFTKSLVKGCLSQKCFSSVFFVKKNNGLTELYVVSRVGEGFWFTHFDVDGLKLAIENNDLDKCAEIQKQMQMTVFQLKDCHTCVNSVTYTNNEGFQTLLVAGSGDFSFSEWYVDEQSIVVKDYCWADVSFKKVLETPDAQYIVALDANDYMNLYTRTGYMYLSSWTDEKVDDFVFFTTNTVETDQSNYNSSAIEETKIVLLTMPNNKNRRLIVLTLPLFKHVYTLTVSETASLAIMPPHEDTMMFIEGVISANFDDSLYEYGDEKLEEATVRMRCLIETIPENRFSRLLHKKKFQEAEDFANLFHLDVELVHKVNSIHILDHMSPWGMNHNKNNTCFNDLLKELKVCFNKIEDVEHITSCCLKAQLPTLHAAYDLLIYAQEKVNFKGRQFKESSQLFQSLLDGINRLATFEVAFGAALFSGSSWAAFLSTSLLDEVIKCFSSQNLNAGIIIWRRHQSEFENIFTISKLQQILNSFPGNTPSQKIIPWFREDFVPYVLTVLPDGQAILAEWLEKMARNLELDEQDCWPDNALDMAEVMYKAFSNVNQSTQDRGVATPMQFATKITKLSIPYFKGVHDSKCSNAIDLSTSMENLGNLVKSLREVKSLHHEYNCRLSLGQFLSENTKQITFRLLNRVAAAELIPMTIKKYVKPYVLKNNLKHDPLLYEYIVGLIEAKNELASLWESKVIAVINEIEKKDCRCQATLKLMLRAQTPWSDAVAGLVASMLKTCPENEKLQKQYQFSLLGKMVTGYGIQHTNFADIRKTECMINYMFSTEKPEALEDALKICKHFPVFSEVHIYTMRIQWWITQDKLPLALELLKNLKPGTAHKVVCYFIPLCANHFDPVDEEDVLKRIRMTEAITLMLKVISKRVCDYELQQLTKILKPIFCLQKEYRVFLSPSKYDDEDFRRALIEQYLYNPIDKEPLCPDGQKRKNSSLKPAKLIRFGELLGFKRASLNEVLVDVYIRNNEHEDVYALVCSMLKDTFSDGFHRSACKEQLNVFHKVAYFLMTSHDESFNWISAAKDLHNMTSQATALCGKNQLCDYLSLSQLMRFVNSLALQCEMFDYQDDPKKDNCFLHEWIIEGYTDDSLIMTSTSVLPLLQNIISLCTTVSNKDHYPYNFSCLTGCGIMQVSELSSEDGNPKVAAVRIELLKVIHNTVKLLQEHNQQELSLQMLMLGVSLIVHRGSTLQMNLEINSVDNQLQQTKKQLIEVELKSMNIMKSKGEELLHETCSKLVCLALGHRVVDHDLSLCYMDVLPLNEGQQLLLRMKNKFGNKYTRIQAIARVGMDYAALRNDIEFSNSCRMFKECAFWGRKLQLLRVPPPWNIFAVNSDPLEKDRILNIIVQHKTITLQSILTFCEAFSYEEDNAILLYINNLLTPSSDPMTISTDTSYQTKIDEAVHALHSSEKYEKLILSCLTKISPYDYERLVYVFKKISEVTDNEERRITCDENISLLNMLFGYTRTASEIDYDVECASLSDFLEDAQILHGKGVLPDIAKKRLPFHPFTVHCRDVWAILNPELTSENNLNHLEPIVNKLKKINIDQMFLKTIQNIARKELFKSQSNDITFKLNMVENILNKIKDHTEMIAIAKWLAKCLPRGAEKAKVLKALLQRVDLLVTESTGEMLAAARQAHQKFLCMYKRVSVESALVEHNITEEKFFPLCNNPIKLIVTLYEEYGDKVHFDTGHLTGAPEIHSLVESIAKISEDIDLKKIHCLMMEKWLPCIRVASVQDADDMMGSLRNSDAVRKENECNLRRIIYVLAGCYSRQTVKMLLAAVYEQTEGTFLTNTCRIRSLQTLFTLVDIATIKAESGSEIDEIHNKLVSCIYLSELEQLHINQAEEAFIKCNKESLVKGLWRNHSHVQQGVRLIADICLDYKIFDPKLWNNLLSKLLSFDMISYLTHVLVLLAGVPQLREIPCLTTMWRAVILHPFNSVSCPLTAEEAKSCLQATQLLTRCPVIFDLGLPEIASVMSKAGLHIQSLVCTKLIPDQELRKREIQALLEGVGMEYILTEVNKHRQEGFMDGHLDAIEEEVFDYINTRELFASVHGTVHFDRLISYLVHSDNINNLLLKTINSDRLKSAMSLISLYVAAHPKSSVAQKVAEGMDDKSALLFYLKAEGVYKEAKRHLAVLLKSNSTLNDISISSDESLMFANRTGS